MGLNLSSAIDKLYDLGQNSFLIYTMKAGALTQITYSSGL